MSTKKKDVSVGKPPVTLPALEPIKQMLDAGDLEGAAAAIDASLPVVVEAEKQVKEFKGVLKSALDNQAPIQRAFWENRQGEWEIRPDGMAESYDLIKSYIPKERLVKCISFNIKELVAQNAEDKALSLVKSHEDLKQRLHPHLAQKPQTRALQIAEDKELSKQNGAVQAATVPTTPAANPALTRAAAPAASQETPQPALQK